MHERVAASTFMRLLVDQTRSKHRQIRTLELPSATVQQPFVLVFFCFSICISAFLTAISISISLFPVFELMYQNSSIGWKHSAEKYCTVQEFEFSKLQLSHSDRSAFVLTRHEREQLLLEWGASLQEIVESIRANVRIKHQRRRTVNNRYDRWEEVMEKASRKIKKTILVGRSTSGGATGAAPPTGTAMQPMNNHSSAGHIRTSVPAPPAYTSQHHQDHPQQHHLRPPTTIDSHFRSDPPSLPPTRPVQRTSSSEMPQPPHPTTAESTTHAHNAAPPTRRTDQPNPTIEAESVAATTDVSRGSSMPYQYVGYDPDDIDDDGVFTMEDYTDSGGTTIGTDNDDSNTEFFSVLGDGGGGDYQYAPATPSPSAASVDGNPRPARRTESSSSNGTFVSMLNVHDVQDDDDVDDHDEMYIDGHHLSAITMEDITDITPSAMDDEQDNIFLTSPVSGLTSRYPRTGGGSTCSTSSFPDGNFETLHRDTSFWEVQRNNADGPCIMRRSAPVTISEDSMIDCFPPTAKTNGMAVPRLISRWD